MDIDLVINERYSAVITALNANGEGDYNVTVEFGKCCNLNKLQNITLSLICLQLLMTSRQ